MVTLGNLQERLKTSSKEVNDLINNKSYGEVSVKVYSTLREFDAYLREKQEELDGRLTPRYDGDFEFAKLLCLEPAYEKNFENEKRKGDIKEFLETFEYFEIAKTIGELLSSQMRMIRCSGREIEEETLRLTNCIYSANELLPNPCVGKAKLAKERALTYAMHFRQHGNLDSLDIALSGLELAKIQITSSVNLFGEYIETSFVDKAKEEIVEIEQDIVDVLFEKAKYLIDIGEVPRAREILGKVIVQNNGWIKAYQESNGKEEELAKRLKLSGQIDYQFAMLSDTVLPNGDIFVEGFINNSLDKFEKAWKLKGKNPLNFKEAHDDVFLTLAEMDTILYAMEKFPEKRYDREFGEFLHVGANLLRDVLCKIHPVYLETESIEKTIIQLDELLG